MLSKNLIPTSRTKIKLFPFDSNIKTEIDQLYDDYENEKSKEFKTEIPYYIEKEPIPEDPYEFYKDFGYFEHPRTLKPIENLTPYQYQIWNSKAKTTIVVKPQKTGVTTSTLLQDFQTAITTGKGRDILIIAQTLGHAIEHIHTLKRMIVNSPKYRKYLITKSSEMYFKEEKTKLGAIYIKNPDNPFRPSRIIATPFSVHGVWSWKNVYRIHMSDVAATETVDDKSVYEAAGTRFASTEGYWLIESPPNGTNNYYFELYEKYKNNEDPASVNVITVDIEEAIANQVVSREFIESERKRLGHLWFKYYGSQFIEASGNLFSIESIDRAVTLGQQTEPIEEYRPTSEKYMAIDQGYSTSKFVVLVAEWNREKRHLRLLHGEELQSPLFENARDKVLQLRKQYGNVLNIAFDATSRQEFGMSLKVKIGEDSYWPRVKAKMDESKKNNYTIEKRMVVIPIIFSTESKLFMSQHLQQLLDDPRSLVAISPKFDKLISSLKGAAFDDRGILDKEASPNNDWLDAFMMLSTFIKFREKA